MRVAITGANGHIGANLCRELLAHDHEVVAMVREGADLRGLAGLELEQRLGDIKDAAAVRAALDGVDAVMHLAQPYRTAPGTTMEEMMAPAIEGTNNVVAAMVDAGIDRLVHCSSSAAVGMTPDRDAPRDETCWEDASHSVPYVRAKIAGERRAAELAAEHGLNLSVLLPVAPMGPYDFKTTPTHEAFWDAAKGSGLAAFDISFTDARDTAVGARLILEQGRAGERYLIAGDTMRCEPMADALAGITGKRPQDTWPPKWVLSTVITVTGWFGKAPLTHDMLNGMYGKHFAYSNAKARTELGFEPRPPEQTLREALRWGAYRGVFPDAMNARVAEQLPPEPEWGAPEA